MQGLVEQKQMITHSNMKNDIHKEITQKCIELTGKQFCVNCQTHKPRQGGNYIKFNNGLNQRWTCLTCIIKRRNK